MPLLLLIAILILLYFWYQRSRELFCLHLRQGKLGLVRGSISGPLRSSLQEVLGGAQRGTIRAIRTPHGATLSIRGDIDERAEQRLRNVFGLSTSSQLRAKSIDKRKAAGDLFTVAWLLSFFGRR